MPGLRTVLAALVAISSVATAYPHTAHHHAVFHSVRSPKEWVMTKNNTINSTHVHDTDKSVAQDAPSVSLPIHLVNNQGGNVNVYITGLDGDGAAFFLQGDGTAYYPTNPPAGSTPQTITENVAIALGAQGSTVTVNLPNYISSGRAYVAAGTLSFAVNNGPSGPIVVAPSFTNPSDPNIDVNYGFSELTWNEDAIYSNLSFVDFVGLVISQLVTSSSGNCQVEGLPNGAVPTICNALAAQQASDGQPWSSSCQKDSSGNPIRVLAPLHLMEVSSGALSTYYDSYVDQVWSHYETNNLTITGGPDQTYTGQVDASSGKFVFDVGGSYDKPNINDIMGCNSGPFSNPSGNTDDDLASLVIVPRFCAAFVRSTLLLSGGNNQPNGVDESQYYSTSPTDHYSRIVHATELDGKGYAFAYDDVAPDSAPAISGLCDVGSPTGWTLYAGGSN